MTYESLLGLPLEEALSVLSEQGIEPEIIRSRAPKRTEDIGNVRVVRVRREGRELTVCGFLDQLKPDSFEKGETNGE